MGEISAAVIPPPAPVQAAKAEQPQLSKAEALRIDWKARHNIPAINKQEDLRYQTLLQIDKTKADHAFHILYPGDDERYSRLGIYINGQGEPLPQDDSVFQALQSRVNTIEETMQVEFNEYNKKDNNASNLSEVAAIADKARTASFGEYDAFVKQYPEKAQFYAQNNQNIARAIQRVEAAKTQKRSQAEVGDENKPIFEYFRLADPKFRQEMTEGPKGADGKPTRWKKEMGANDPKTPWDKEYADIAKDPDAKTALDDKAKGRIGALIILSLKAKREGRNISISQPERDALIKRVKQFAVECKLPIWDDPDHPELSSPPELRQSIDVQGFVEASLDRLLGVGQAPQPQKEALPSTPKVEADAVQQKAEAVKKAEARKQAVQDVLKLIDKSGISPGSAREALYFILQENASAMVEDRIRDLDRKFRLKEIDEKVYTREREFQLKMLKKAQEISKKVDVELNRIVGSEKSTSDEKVFAHDVKRHILINRKNNLNNSLMRYKVMLNQSQDVGEKKELTNVINELNDQVQAIDAKIEVERQVKRNILGLREGDPEPADKISTLAVTVAAAVTQTPLTDEERAGIASDPVNEIITQLENAVDTDHPENMKKFKAGLVSSGLMNEEEANAFEKNLRLLNLESTVKREGAVNTAKMAGFGIVGILALFAYLASRERATA